MVTITYAPLGPQYGAMQSLHYVRDDAVWLNMIKLFPFFEGLSKNVKNCQKPSESTVILVF
jgi:hypothetical protein